MNIARDTDQKENFTVNLKDRSLRGGGTCSKLNAQFNLTPMKGVGKTCIFRIKCSKSGGVGGQLHIVHFELRQPYSLPWLN